MLESSRIANPSESHVTSSGKTPWRIPMASHVDHVAVLAVARSLGSDSVNVSSADSASPWISSARGMIWVNHWLLDEYTRTPTLFLTTHGNIDEAAMRELEGIQE